MTTKALEKKIARMMEEINDYAEALECYCPSEEEE